MHVGKILLSRSITQGVTANGGRIRSHIYNTYSSISNARPKPRKEYCFATEQNFNVIVSVPDGRDSRFLVALDTYVYIFMQTWLLMTHCLLIHHYILFSICIIIFSLLYITQWMQNGILIKGYWVISLENVIFRGYNFENPVWQMCCGLSLYFTGNRIRCVQL